MARRTRRRRTQVDLAGVRELTGASVPTIRGWYRRRAATGFPQRAATDRDGRAWWWLDEVAGFRSRYLADGAATFTTVDRSGDPDDLLTAPQAARVLGYKDHRSLTSALLDHPDRVEELPSGRLRRLFLRRTVWAYADGRALRHSTGRPPGTTNPATQPHWYATDPRLAEAIRLVARTDAAGTGTRGLGIELARRLQVSPSTGRRLIATARRLAATSP